MPLTSQNKKETEYFLKQFKGHTTIACQSTKQLNGQAFFHYNQEIEKTYSHIAENNENAYNVYFTVNETNDHGRKAHNIESIRAVYADDDELRLEPLKFPLKPSIITRSSGNQEQGYKHQYYWLTETNDYKEWERVLKGIIRVYGTDVNCHDLARLLRVPGFYNHKYDPPELCSLLECRGTVYPWEDILLAFPPLPEETRAALAEVPELTGFNEIEYTKRFLDPQQSGDITNSMNSLIAHWAHHYSSQKINVKLEHLYDEISQENREQHEERYYKARIQADKFIKTAKAKVAQYRALKDLETPPEIPPYNEIPLDLRWDWSALASNEFTMDAVTPYLYEAACEAGAWNGIGPGPAVVSAMAVCSALLNKNVIIHETHDELTHYCSQGSVIVMDTGASKSSIYKTMNKPFFAYEEELREKWDKIKNTNHQLADAIKGEMERAKKDFNKSGQHTEQEFITFAQEQGKLQDKIDSIPLRSPVLHTNDITEETIFTKMSQNNGVIALISDDARKPINILLGEYKNGITGEGVYISGFTRTSMTRERVSQEEKRVNEPCLNCLYFVQPDAALKLRESDMYVPSGLAARMPLFFYPTDGVDIVRNRQRRDIDHSKMEPYYRHLRGLCLQRADNPLHVRLSQAGMERCKEFDEEFATMLENEWKGEFSKLNKFVSTSLQYATCLAALDDPEFQKKYRTKGESNNDYELSVKYMNMGFNYAKILFQQSVMTQNSLIHEGLPRKCENILTRLKTLYANGKITEGFVVQGDFINNFSVAIRSDFHAVIDFLHEKKWLYTSIHRGERRKLNNGFPNKLVDPGDLVYHLNVNGINKRADMELNKIEDRTHG